MAHPDAARGESESHRERLLFGGMGRQSLTFLRDEAEVVSYVGDDNPFHAHRSPPDTLSLVGLAGPAILRWRVDRSGVSPQARRGKE